MIMTNREIWRDRLMGRRRARGSGGRIRKARAHHAPTARNLRFPRRKDWLCLPKRALLSWPGRSSRGERLMGKEALFNPGAEARDLRAKRPSPTPLPRGEWRGRGGGGGCRHEPQRRASCRSRTPVSSNTQLVILSSASQRADGFAV